MFAECFESFLPNPHTQFKTHSLDFVTPCVRFSSEGVEFQITKKLRHFQRQNFSTVTALLSKVSLSLAASLFKFKSQESQDGALEPQTYNPTHSFWRRIFAHVLLGRFEPPMVENRQKKPPGFTAVRFKTDTIFALRLLPPFEKFLMPPPGVNGQKIGPQTEKTHQHSSTRAN